MYDPHIMGLYHPSKKRIDLKLERLHISGPRLDNFLHKLVDCGKGDHSIYTINVNDKRGINESDLNGKIIQWRKSTEAAIIWNWPDAVMLLQWQEI